MIRFFHLLADVSSAQGRLEFYWMNIRPGWWIGLNTFAVDRIFYLSMRDKCSTPPPSQISYRVRCASIVVTRVEKKERCK